MKLPISLLVLAVFSQALSVQPLAKRSEAKNLETKDSPGKSPVAKSSAKSSVAKQKDNNQTSKRELYEGNFGDRNKEQSSKYEVTGPTPKIVYAKEIQEEVSEQSPTHQIFGMRLPQLIKISDVLSDQDRGSFEAAVAKHLYSPISVYQTRGSSPTSFEVPVPAASQSAYSNPMSYKQQQISEKEQNMQDAPKAVELPNPNTPLYTVNQPRLQFEAYPQALDQNFPQQIFQPQHVPIQRMPSLYPIYDQLGPFRYPGQVVPSQYVHQNGIYQIVPVRPGFDFGNQEGNRDNTYQNQENREQLKAERPKPQSDAPVPNQGYHAHPNGAISFASFSQNLPVNKQYETKPQQQSETLRQPQQAQLQSQQIPVQLQEQIESLIQQSQQQKGQSNQNLQLSPMFHKLIQDLGKYQPVFHQQPQFIPYVPQKQPRPLNALQQHLLYQDPRQPQQIQSQRLPAFKPLPQSLLTSESFLQQTSRSPVITGQPPRPFSFEYQTTSPPDNYDLPVESASEKLTPLPPLKPNYSKYVKPLEPHSYTTQVFLPTPLLPFASSTPKEEPISDQLISSTTIQPSLRKQEDSEAQLVQEETKLQTRTSQPLKPELIHQSEPTLRPPSIQSTTFLPFVTHEPQSNYLQYSTPQPQYQPTKQPKSIKTPPRHEVVIQRQEIQELFFDPPPQHPRALHYQNQRAQIAPQFEQELHQLRSQPHHQLYEQLQPIQYQHEIQDINSQQYLLEARQLHSPQKLDSSQQREPQQYLVQQHSQPLQLLQVVHNPQPKLQQSQQSQQVSYQEKQQQVTEKVQEHVLEQAQQQEARQQQYKSEQVEQQQAEEHAQQQQVAEQAQQQEIAVQVHQQQVAEQAQQQEIAAQVHQQHVAERAQRQEVAEQAEHEQYQQQIFDSNNQIQISTLKPSEDNEKQTETVEIQQQDSQSTTGKPNEQAEHSSELPSLEQPYLGPLQNPSGLPQIYSHQQQLVAQPEYSPLLGVPPYSDVQYFGKFAESIFGNRHH
ncbi:hypothetical protein PYW08_011495 [Mythimna loreyi]|uniref:Uncharacterized protein n=1 Tax=Mythimna loreyi TaxID=667449 RepID=A0ACC2QLI8_9NEOP|nr:hypothetical protein PYW08_011495 [Mythimna loreyi]